MKKNKCIFCLGFGYIVQSIFEAEKEVCEKCNGSGIDQGIEHPTKGVLTNQEFVDLVCALGDNQRTCARKLTRVQVRYVKMMSGSNVPIEVLARDMNIGIITIRNIWKGVSYVHYGR